MTDSVGKSTIRSVANEIAIEVLLEERELLRAQVARGDALLAAVKANAQEESDESYRAEFGPDHKGPSLAGIAGLDGKDREYVYWRHDLSRKLKGLPDPMIALGQRHV